MVIHRFTYATLLVIGHLTCGQTKLDVLGPEINSGFSVHKLSAKSHVSAAVSQQFFTNHQENFSGAASDGASASNLVFNKLSLRGIRRFNPHWYGKLELHRQLGRYYFYNYNRSFSTVLASLGHKGKIDELNFYKEVGASLNNQKPKSIKDLYVYIKFEYAITKNQKPVALASLGAKVDWLGTSFRSDKNDLFVLRAKDESVIRKIDQSWLFFNMDFFLTQKNVLSTHITYFTEYYPAAADGYDKWNVRHYIFGLAWKYYFLKAGVDPMEHVY